MTQRILNVEDSKVGLGAKKKVQTSPHSSHRNFLNTKSYNGRT